mmetsp:Transcript_21797/g.31632  ORF Transcript_21797/g.31632 Transcript_21797/m.31632 type:complete len:239 (+) Transcript_21797:256-972(+)
MPGGDLGAGGSGVEVQLVLLGPVGVGGMGLRGQLGHHHLLAPGHPLLHVLVLVVVAHNVPPGGDHEALGHTVGSEQVVGDGVGAGGGSLAGQGPHLGPGDGDEVVRAAVVLELHVVVRDVVVHLGEGQQVQGSQSGGHHQHVAPVVPVIQVVVRVRPGLQRALHPGGVTAHDKVGSAAVPAALGVEDDLGGPAVDHGGRPDGHHRGLGVKHALVQHRLVLFYADIKGHVVFLGPASQG